jgi:hypothetical protein
MVAKDNYYYNLIFHTELIFGFSSEYFDSNRTDSIFIDGEYIGYKLAYKGFAHITPGSSSEDQYKNLQHLLEGDDVRLVKGLKSDNIKNKIISNLQKLKTFLKGNTIDIKNTLKAEFDALIVSKVITTTSTVWSDTIGTAIESWGITFAKDVKKINFSEYVEHEKAKTCGYFFENSKKPVTRTQSRYAKYPLNNLTSILDNLDNPDGNFAWLKEEINVIEPDTSSDLFTFFEIKCDSPIFRLFYLGNLLIEKLREEFCNKAGGDPFSKIFENKFIDTLVDGIINDESSSSRSEFLNSHHQLSYRNYVQLSELDKSNFNQNYESFKDLADQCVYRYENLEAYWKNYRNLLNEYFNKIKEINGEVYNNNNIVTDTDTDTDTNNYDPDERFLKNLCHVLNITMLEKGLINTKNKSPDVEWKEIIPIIGFFIPEIIPDHGKIYNCELNTNSIIPKLYLKSIHKRIDFENVHEKEKELFKKAYYWDFIHDYGHSGPRRNKLFEVENKRSGYTIDKIYTSIFGPPIPENYGNVENELLDNLIQYETEKEYITNLSQQKIDEPDNPKYWINNASNYKPENKICTYGSMLDSQGFCGNCILYIPTDEKSQMSNHIYIEHFDADIKYDITITGFYKINITYQVIRLKNEDNKPITIHIDDTINSVTKIECWICILVTTELNVTFDDDKKYKFDYLSKLYTGNGNDGCFHSENSYTKVQQIKQFISSHMDKLNEHENINYSQEVLQKILKLSIPGNDCDNLIIYGTQGAQNFCNAKSVAANICPIENYDNDNNIIIRGNYFKKYIGDHLQELESLFGHEDCNFFGLLNNDRPSAARVRLLYYIFGINDSSPFECKTYKTNGSYIKQGQVLAIPKYNSLVNFEVKKVPAGGATTCGIKCKQCGSLELKCSKFDEWIEENNLSIDEISKEKYEIIYDNIKEDPISTDFFIVFIMNGGKFMEIDINKDDPATTILSAIYNLEYAELDECVCTGGSKRKKNRTNKRKTKRKTRKKKTKRKTKRKSKVRKSKKTKRSKKRSKRK